MIPPSILIQLVTVRALAQALFDQLAQLEAVILEECRGEQPDPPPERTEERAPAARPCAHGLMTCAKCKFKNGFTEIELLGGSPQAARPSQPPRKPPAESPLVKNGPSLVQKLLSESEMDV